MHVHGVVRGTLRADCTASCVNFLNISVVIYHRGGKRPCTVGPRIRVGLQVGVKVISRILDSRFVIPNKRKHFSVSYFPARRTLVRQRRRSVRDCPLIIGSNEIISNCLPLMPIAPGDHCQTFIYIATTR